MGVFGLWVIGATVWSLIYEGRPSAVVMGSVGILALAANVVSAYLLYRFREGDANMRSVWLCSRNDAIGNLAVVAAASGVFATGSNWPDLGVAAIMAGLALFASARVLAHAAREWREHGETEREAGAG
jgi:Co/Zn/Cd efflux system component